MAVLPAGTGNLLAANLGLSSDLAAGLAVALEGGLRRLDVGTVEGRHFAVMAGMGFDAHMLDATSDTAQARIGWPAYVVGVMKHLKYRPMRVTVRIDGATPMRRRARSVLVANVGRPQGGVRLLSEANPAASGICRRLAWQTELVSRRGVAGRRCRHDGWCSETGTR
jgi:diacylglycerol kinase family enzyme